MAITICTVSGNVKDLLGDNVQGVTVKVSTLTPFIHTGSVISGEIKSTTTDASGNWSLDVVETETVGKKLTFTFEYSDGSSGRKRKAYTVIVPNSAAETLTDLVASEDFPATITTLPAANVTVAAGISNLDATTVQAALSEHQDDIDTLETDVATAQSTADDHIADAAGAHAASAISNSPSGNLAATTVQAALDELQTDIDTRALDSDLDDHLADTTDAHDASAISNTPSGNLAATDVQSALDELQTDIDTRALDSDLDAKFDTSNGHDHDGTDSKKIVFDNLDTTGGSTGQYWNPDGSGGGSWTAVPGATLTVASKTGAYTLTSSDDVILADASGGDFTLTLPASASNSGKKFHIINTGSSGTVTIDGNASETVNGVASVTLCFQNSFVVIVSDGSNWVVIGGKTDGQIILHTTNGYGSTTNNRIVRWSTAVENLGSAITYTDSSTDGGSFTINEDGVYSISVCVGFTTAAQIGISRNASNLTTPITTLASAERLQFTYTDSASRVYSCSWSGHLKSGDVIRAQTSGDTIQASISRHHFNISKVA